MTTDVTVQYFSGCPNWQTALKRVEHAAAQAGVEIRLITQAVETDEDAAQLGFIGSPTILVDGSDPFARPGAVPALACRVYSTPEGLAGSPSVGEILDVLTRGAA